MRYFKGFICLVSVLMLSACTQSQFMDLSGFIYNYNKVNDEKIDFTDFYIDEERGSTYTFFGDGIILTLEAADGRITECRLSLPKLDIKGNKSETYGKDIGLFRQVLTGTLRAYCHYDRYSAEEVLGLLSLSDDASFYKQGELTLKRGNFYFICYSDDITFQFRILNLYLTEVEPTKKPR